MLVINYKENKPISDYFKYSVNGNNQADIVRFVLLKEQEGIDLGDESFLVYAKCTNGYDFTDKVLISREDIEITDSEVIVDWHLLRKHTANESLKVSVSFESEEIVWQTQTFTLKINNGVLGDEEIENNYPTIIAQLQQEIEDIKKQKGGGSNKSIVLEILPFKTLFLPEKISCLNLIRIKLNKFTVDDIGTKLFLLHYSPKPQRKIIEYEGLDYYVSHHKRYFKHPKNYDSDSTNIQKLGYGTIALRPIDWHAGLWGDVPNFMPHNGFVQTEYEITEQHIEQGYMDIDIGNELLSLLRPDVNDDRNKDGSYYVFNERLHLMPKKGHFITFAQYKEGELECLPTNKLFVRFHNISSGMEKNSIVIYDEETNKYNLRGEVLITHLLGF